MSRERKQRTITAALDTKAGRARRTVRADRPAPQYPPVGISPNGASPLGASAVPAKEPVQTVQAPGSTVPPPPDGREFGASGTQNYGGFIIGEDYNPKLDGVAALTVYDQMRKSDAQVASTLRAIKLPLLSATWVIQPPTDGDEQDQAIADFVQMCLFDDDAMIETWPFVLQHILLMVDFGFSVHEQVWTQGPSGEFRLHRLAPRMPRTIHRWLCNTDGTLRSIIQWAPKIAVSPDGTITNTYGYWEIPADYALVVVNEREGDNWYGRSMLRSAYMHWFYKTQAYQIDGVKQDRFGVGIPVAKVDKDFDNAPGALDKIEKNLKGLRSHERAYLVEPLGVTYRIMVPEGSRNTGNDLIQSIEHHNQMIARNLMTGFLTQGDQRHGSFGAAETIWDAFISAEKALAAAIGSAVKHQVIKKLCDANFEMAGRQYPNAIASDLSNADVAALSDVLAKLAPGKFITPDDSVEEYLRKINGLPPMPEDLKGQDRRPTTPPPTGGPESPEPPEPPSPETPPTPPAPPSPPSPPTPADGGSATRQADAASGRTPAREARSGTASSRVVIDGQSFRRAPTALEERVLAYREMPPLINQHMDSLTSALADIRRRQLEALAARVAQKDSRPTAEFTDLRPEVLGSIPYVSDVERAIKDAQAWAVDYGRQTVDQELSRQRGQRQAEAAALSAAGASARKTKSSLVSSARAKAVQLSSHLEGEIVTTAIRYRRTGMQGEELKTAIVQALVGSVESLARSVSRQAVNEAFGMGRAAEAHQHASEIQSCTYSALMDDATCDVCEELDWQEVEYGSADYYVNLPPNPNCLGRDNCRCVYIYVVNEAADENGAEGGEAA